MNPKTKLQLALYATSVVAVAVAVSQSLATNGHRIKLAEITNRRVEFTDQLVAVHHHPAAVTSDSGMKRDETNATPPEPRLPDTSETQRADVVEALLNDPNLQSLYLDSQRATIDGLYAPFVQRLGLSPELAEQLYERVMERNEQRMDLADVMHSSGKAIHDPVITALDEKNSSRFRSAQISLLGPEGFQQLQEYERTLSAWDVVNRFAGVAALEGRPLDLGQASALTDVIAKSSPPYRAGGTADTNILEWNTILTESRQVLTSPQYESFKNMVPRYPVLGH